MLGSEPWSSGLLSLIKDVVLSVREESEHANVHQSHSQNDSGDLRGVAGGCTSHLCDGSAHSSGCVVYEKYGYNFDRVPQPCVQRHVNLITILLVTGQYILSRLIFGSAFEGFLCFAITFGVLWLTVAVIYFECFYLMPNRDEFLVAELTGL